MKIRSSYATIVSHDGRAITIDGHRRVLLSGSIHYPRSTPEMWPDLIKKSKEGGLDAIETYVFWNAHEPTRRQYDFSGKLDLIRFLKTIKDEGLYGVLRIGPYACAEWNYGGFPVWLHNIPEMVFRTTNKAFMDEMQNFTTMIVDMVKKEKLFASQGGPIILAQIENEYGNVMGPYGEAGKTYIKWCANMAQALNVGVPWIMCQQNDAPQPMLNTCNGFYCDNFKPNNPNTPKMWTENWTGWFKQWGGKNPHRTTEDVAYSVAKFFQRGGTFNNYYMYHGGTNFDRTAGGPYITTSYDYDAPLDEYGNLNQPKYGHLKKLHDVLHSMEKTLTYGNISTIDFGKSASITTQTSMMVKKPNKAEDDPSTLKWSWRPENMDDFLLKGKGESTKTQLVDQKVVSNDQSDYLWYMTTVKFRKRDLVLGKNMTLRINSTAHVLHAFVNGKHIGNQHAENEKFHYVFEKDAKFKSGRNVISLLSITVGLQNYGSFFESVPTGITGPISIIGRNSDETIVKDLSAHKWSYKTGLNGFENQLFRTESPSKWSAESVPLNRSMTWYKATFKAPFGNDPVVVDLLGLGKGTAWVNGNNIGRYWPAFISSGDGCSVKCNYRGAYHAEKCLTGCGEPTQRWYHVPRSFLNAGDNTLVLFEEMGGNPSLVNFQTTRVGSVCANVYEKNVIELSCDRKPISAIKFASFGNPDGNCGSFEKGTCEEINNAVDILTQECVGKEKCSIDVSTEKFGAPDCGGAARRLAVEAIC
ncbi:beta-galactosidase 15-like [Brassica napus]|uniref:beta-galactosidase 15-like n=1 Tax=Brassica napus TaxID=3708 RepID=UPI002078C816|nr:beta-galactosidase 15-like [Brassica napus]